MKLVFYGGDDETENFELNTKLLKLSNKKKPKITFIPACSYDSTTDFYYFVQQFNKFKLTNFINFPIDVRFSTLLLREALKSDIIHMGGGNTYYFLKYLRKNNLISELKTFVQNGGILTGLSAGAIIMTPNINTAGFPEFDRDDNDENLRNFDSLGLVDFEFFPHFKNSKRYTNELMQYSKKIKTPLYACPDGSGIVVENSKLKFIGKVFRFEKGQKFTLKPSKK